MLFTLTRFQSRYNTNLPSKAIGSQTSCFICPLTSPIEEDPFLAANITEAKQARPIKADAMPALIKPGLSRIVLNIKCEPTALSIKA